jgi:hypothetical protein
MTANTQYLAYDAESSSSKGWKDKAVYAGLAPCVFDEGELVSTDLPATDATPLSLALACREAVGFDPAALDYPQYTQRACREVYELRVAGPPSSPLGELLRTREAHELLAVDVLLGWGQSWRLIESVMGRPMDQSVKRLVKPGSFAEADMAAEEATRVEAQKELARAKAIEIEGDKVHTEKCPDGECWVKISEEDGYHPEFLEPVFGRPSFVDADGFLHYRKALLPGLRNGLKSNAKRTIVAPGDPLPIPRKYLNSPKEEMTRESFDEHRRGLARTLRGQITKPRPESTLRHKDAAREFLAQHGPRLLAPPTSIYSHILPYCVEGVVRGYLMSPVAAVALMEEAIVKAGGGQRPWNAPARQEIERLVVQAYESTAPELIEWGALIPRGAVDRLAEKVSAWAEPIRRFLGGEKKTATSAELVDVLKASGQDVDEDRPEDHQAIQAIMNEAQYTKRRPVVDGTRVSAFVRE